MTTEPKVSKREALATKIADWLRDSGKATAPFGVLVSKDAQRNCYVVTFGVARYLDATVELWGDKFYRIRAAGPLASRLDGADRYGMILRNYDDVIAALKLLLCVK